jgi:uncharacterized protein
MHLISILIFISLFAGNLKTKEIRFNNKKSLKVEIADTNDLRTHGLMHRTHLDEDSGMLFVFESSQVLSFWNKNTFVPLSIGYLDENKVLKEIYNMKNQNIMERQQNIESYPGRCQCRYALEVNIGWFKKNKIKVGDKFSFINPQK